MREIKFRAWLRKEKEHREVITISFENELVEVFIEEEDEITYYDFDEIILEQYTGLKDKNGVEIYLGDIIAISNLNILVYFDKSNASFRLKSTLDDYALTIDKVQRLEVIGNINENKELLE